MEANIQKKKNKYQEEVLRIVGVVITLVQLIFSGIFVIALLQSEMIPAKYILTVMGVLAVLFGITFGMQFLKKVRVFGMIISVLLIVSMIVGSLYFKKINKTLQAVGGAEYKTDNMIVVVQKENPAQTIMDAKNYRFGYQTASDQKNTQTMLEDIQKHVEREIKSEEYETIVDVANALLDGKVEAAVYNEAFTGIIEEYIENYSDQVRILYQYGIETKIEEKEEKSVEEPFNVFISGIDVEGAISKNSRSDVNIIMTVNPESKKILLTTTPRDYYVPIPNISGGAKDKLTHAGIYGVDASMATLESIYGIEITYYARVNFTSLIKIVDALGGVDVDSAYAFSSRGYTFKEGINHMTGEAALAFSRERYSFSDGDNQRGKNQEAVLTAILQKAMSPAILTSADKILAQVSDCVETNMTKDEMAKFINRQLEEATGWTIESVAATGKGDKQSCYSSGSQILYVMNPNMDSVNYISSRMQQVLAGE